MSNNTGKKICLKRLNDEVIAFSDNIIVVQSHELVEDATLQRMFGDLGELRCWRDGEEMAFAEQNRHQLGPNGNFFKLAGDRVSRVYLVSQAQPLVGYVESLSLDRTWNAKYKPRVFSSREL